MTEFEKPRVTQVDSAIAGAVDVKEERRSFEVWWAAWCPGQEAPSVTSHVFDAWLSRARHRTQAQAASAAREAELTDRLENLVIAIEMGWDLDGVVKAALASLNQHKEQQL